MSGQKAAGANQPQVTALAGLGCGIRGLVDEGVGFTNAAKA